MLPKMDSRSLTDCQSIKQFPAIDLVKFICSILVVAIHVAPLGTSASPAVKVINFSIMHYIARLAVPFFFVCTGFLVFRRTNINELSMSSSPVVHARKSYWLYLIWTLIYLPKILSEILSCKNGILWGCLLFIRKFIFTGSFGPLWYLNATAFSLLMVTFMLRKKSGIRKMLVCAFVLYLIGLLPMAYVPVLYLLRPYALIWNTLRLIEKIIITTGGAVFEGFLFVGIGALFAYKPIRLTNKQAVCGFILSMILLFMESFLLEYHGWSERHDVYFFLIPAVFFLFYIVSHLQLKSRPVYLYLRSISSLVYLLHMGVYTVLKKILPAVFSQNCVLFLLTLSITLILSCVVIRISKAKRFAFIKRLFA